MYDNLLIYDNIFDFEMQIYFSLNRGFSRITQVTRILRGFLLVECFLSLHNNVEEFVIFLFS